MLTDLPEEIYGLPALRSLSLKGNSFKISDRLGIAQRLPDVDLDLRENWVANEVIDTEAARLWKEMADLLEKGNKQWFNNAGNPVMAIKIYDEVLVYFNEGKVVDNYRHLYTYYIKTNACSNVPKDGGYNEMSADEKQQYAQLCVETGKMALSLLPQELYPSTSMGRFYYEVIRIVGNAMAWSMYEVYEEKEKMEEALTILNRAIECINNKNDYYIYDTQVRILLRLGREEEAWQIVRRTLELDYSFPHFKDITGSSEYKKWLVK